VQRILLEKVGRVLSRKADAALGSVFPLAPTLSAMSARPFELHLELTNLCNANCVFCPYQFQQREVEYMSDTVLEKAVSDYVAIGGGSVGLTPIVGDALIDPKFLARVQYLRSLPAIDRIWLTTNAILLDKHGVENVLDAGLSFITISTAGFEEEMYRRVYRNSSYQRMRRNVVALLDGNRRRGNPIPITIGLRPDRPLEEVMKHLDFQEILSYKPALDFTWSYTSAGGRISREELPSAMKLRVVSKRREPCVSLYNGPIVLADGTVMACSCVASMDATADLGIGNVLETPLLEIWQGDQLRRIRQQFESQTLNRTCATCDMYRDLDLYRTREGRLRATLNRQRASGMVVGREDRPAVPFSGG
jgi:radical SAM protein with 4Fe4S-binding SPASM domain